MLALNQRLGSYLILELIGAGGMGSVYRAEHQVLGRIDALKVLATHLTVDPTFQKRFIYEAKLQSSLRHPHVAEVYDCFVIGDYYCISMEYVEGHPLSQLLEGGVLGEDRYRRVFLQVLDAIGFAHSRNIVHRDIKSSNILLTAGDQVKMVDFGIAKIVGEQTDFTAAGDRVGTTRTMSPEQILGKEITPASDVYSLGVVLYEACTGRYPFDGATDYAIKRAHVHDTPLRPQDIASHVGEELGGLILQCLAKEPGDRFKDAREMGNALEGLTMLYVSPPLHIAGERPEARENRQPVIPTRFTTVRIGPGTGLWWSVTALILMVTTVLGLYFWKSRQRVNPAPVTTERVSEPVPSSPPEPPPINVGISPQTGVVTVITTEDPTLVVGTGTNPPVLGPTVPGTNGTGNAVDAGWSTTNAPLVEGQVAVTNSAYMTLREIVLDSDQKVQKPVSPQIIRVEAKTGAWDTYPKIWRIIFYSPETATRRQIIHWEEGEIRRVISSVSPPLVNNQRLSWSYDKVLIDSDMILQKCNEYALERSWKTDSVELVLEKVNEYAVSPTWTCILRNEERKVATLRVSAQTGEILSEKK
ncbi:MAG: serine/threonine-protein kinase [Verrucomicrobiae bacterium]|nr:serine/threonine-protein kinase [Verrucomicrobiae bacterium]